MSRFLTAKGDDIYRYAYALKAARAELARLFELFPELRQELKPGGPGAFLLRKAAKPNAVRAALQDMAAESNGRPAVSVRAAIEPLLTATPQDTATLRAKLDASGYVHTGSTRLNNRIAQEAIALVRAGKAVKTKRGWRLAKGAPKP